MTTKRLVLMASSLAALLLTPAQARADFLLSPYIGGNVGGDTVQTQTNFGVSVAWMGARIIGWQFDAGWAPDFFDLGEPAGSALINKSSVSTYMFNVILGAPVSGTSGRSVRPYGSAGIGAIHTKVGSDLGLVDQHNTDFGWNAGAGTMGFFSPHVGVQGDVRYFQDLQNSLKGSKTLPDIGRFRFWRITGGVVLRFGGQ